MKIDECIEILDAVRQRKPLEYRSVGDQFWKDLLTPALLDDGNVTLDFHEKEYRVKTAATAPHRFYRAYTGTEEFVREAVNHECMLIRSLETGMVLAPSMISDNMVICGSYRLGYATLAEYYVWNDDNTPVGMHIRTEERGA